MTHENAWRTCVLSLAAALVLAAPGRAAAQPAGCTYEIPSLPYTINSSGTYCLKNTMYTNLASGAAITIGGAYQATVDLRGYALNNVAAGTSSTAVGVMGLNKSNVTVRNGRIQSFKSGVTLDGTGSHSNVVEDIQVDQPHTTGIVISGNGHQVRRCAVTRFGLAGSVYAVGILAMGTGHVFEANQVLDSVSSAGWGMSLGGTNHVVVGNRVLEPQDLGLSLCSTCKYRDNLVSGASTSYQGGMDVGNNQ